MKSNIHFSEVSSKNFIHLKSKIFAEYIFVFHINDGYKINGLSEINTKLQLRFQKIKNKTQHLNLMLVDSVFPVLLADLVLEVFLHKINSFQQYTNLKDKPIVISQHRDLAFYNYKFHSFINKLLFSSLGSNKIFRGEFEINKIYYQKTENESIKFYSYLQLSELLNMLFSKMRLKINRGKSSFSNQEIHLCFQILVE